MLNRFSSFVLTCKSHTSSSQRFSLIHRTHVAGTVCGATYGVAKNCRLCSVKVMDDQGNGYTEGIIAGIDHVVAKCVGSKLLCVANASIGGDKSAAENKAVANAVAKGIVMVVAAGNESEDACVKSPASELSAITVGNVDRKDEEAVTSNYGPCVDVYAPGEDIKSAGIKSNTDTAILSGTSMAFPRKFFYLYWHISRRLSFFLSYQLTPPLNSVSPQMSLGLLQACDPQTSI